jgi:ABC-type thiamine transport system substrate-binding protein
MIQAGFPGISQASFPIGTYRLVLSYSTSATSLSQQNTTTIYSATFSVANSS